MNILVGSSYFKQIACFRGIFRVSWSYRKKSLYWALFHFIKGAPKLRQNWWKCLEMHGLANLSPWGHCMKYLWFCAIAYLFLFSMIFEKKLLSRCESNHTWVMLNEQTKPNGTFAWFLRLKCMMSIEKIILRPRQFFEISNTTQFKKGRNTRFS